MNFASREIIGIGSIITFSQHNQREFLADSEVTCIIGIEITANHTIIILFVSIRQSQASNYVAGRLEGQRRNKSCSGILNTSSIRGNGVATLNINSQVSQTDLHRNGQRCTIQRQRIGWRCIHAYTFRKRHLTVTKHVGCIGTRYLSLTNPQIIGLYYGSIQRCIGIRHFKHIVIFASSF